MLKGKNILQQEEEFLKLNAEIDLKTKDLMTQVDQIKEIQSDNDKLYSNWEKSEPITSVQLLESKDENEKKKVENESITPNLSSEENFAFQEYLCRIKDDVDSKSENCFDLKNLKNSQEEDIDVLCTKNGKSKQNIRHSAKTVTSLIGTQGAESALSLGITRHKSEAKLKYGKAGNEVIPEALKGVGHDGITRFLTAKVKLLTEQLEVMQKDEKKHLEKIKELQLHKDKSTEERDKLIQQANMSRSILIKYEQQANTIVAQFQTAQAENSHLKKEVETLKREMRQSNKNHSANELKLNRTLEEVEKLKVALQQMKQEEKELKEIHRKKTEDLSNTIRKLDRQRLELLNGFKKQLLIIDNLKRQKALVEAGKLVKGAEEDFINFLDSNPSKGIRQTDANKMSKS